VPHFLPELQAGEAAITLAFHDIQYCHRTSKKKGFCDDPRVIRERLYLMENIDNIKVLDIYYFETD
jgi:hypothetical protein